jgi:hypothetical protein
MLEMHVSTFRGPAVVGNALVDHEVILLLQDNEK